jgi:hypothetical protein
VPRSITITDSLRPVNLPVACGLRTCHQAAMAILSAAIRCAVRGLRIGSNRSNGAAARKLAGLNRRQRLPQLARGESFSPSQIGSVNSVHRQNSLLTRAMSMANSGIRAATAAQPSAVVVSRKTSRPTRNTRGTISEPIQQPHRRTAITWAARLQRFVGLLQNARFRFRGSNRAG